HADSVPSIAQHFQTQNLRHQGDGLLPRTLRELCYVFRPAKGAQVPRQCRRGLHHPESVRVRPRARRLDLPAKCEKLSQRGEQENTKVDLPCKRPPVEHERVPFPVLPCLTRQWRRQHAAASRRSCCTQTSRCPSTGVRRRAKSPDYRPRPLHIDRKDFGEQLPP